MNLHGHKHDDHHHVKEETNLLMDTESYLWKCIAFLMGLYMFFMFEVIMHAFGGGHSHSHGVVSQTSTGILSHLDSLLLFRIYSFV